MKIDKNFIVNILLTLVIIFLGYQIYNKNQMIDEQTVQLSSKNEDKKNTTIVYEQKLESLKKNNKTLYDSLKIYKEQIDYLAQFKYKKKYVVRDTITKIKFDTINNIIPQTVNEYVYSNNNQNDTLNYQLKIGSTTQPNWYELNLEVSDKFTLVNKKVDNVNETTIETTSNNTQINDVTVFKQKQKLKDKIEIGPSITAGYCLNGKTFDIVIGVSATFDIW